MTELLAKSRPTEWMSTLDLTNSFWQVELQKESRKYTAFQHKGKTYQFCVTPFGLSTSSAALVRALDQVLDKEFDDFALVYVDDMVCQSNTFTEQLNHLETIFEKS